MRRDAAAKPLKALFTKAFEYSDGWVDDARMGWRRLNRLF